MPQPHPAWEHTEDGLALTIADRRVPVPDLIVDWFIGPGGIGTSADVGADLINLEGQIREVAAELGTRVDEADQSVVDARATLSASTTPRRSLRARRRRALARKNLLTAIEDHATLVATLGDVRALQTTVRQFVIDLNCAEGLLAEASAGWQRSPDLPASVVVFDDQEAFIQADSRRAAPWSSSAVGEYEFGQQWRRDGDDDEPNSQPLDRSGPWTVGHSPHSGEIYAIRRSSRLPQQVWLLGKGFTTREAQELLIGIEQRMREPNSIILAAAIVHAARHRHLPVQDDGVPGPRETTHPPAGSVAVDA